MNSQVEKITVYSGNEKNPIVIPEGEHPHPETDLSFNDKNQWPEGLPLEKALRRLIVRSKIRNERKPEPSHRYQKQTKKPELWRQRIVCYPMTKLKTRGTWIQ